LESSKRFIILPMQMVSIISYEKTTLHWIGQPETAISTRRHERAARDRTKKDKQAGHWASRDSVTRTSRLDPGQATR
jgi:hypothetical protein